MNKENKTIHITDLGVDLACVINERNAYDNNAVTVFLDAADYLNHIDSVARMSDVVAEQNNTSKIISGIYVTQRLQNVYPLFDFDELVRFRGMIWSGISKELQLSRPISVDELKEAHSRFIDDEIKLCSVLRNAINRHLSAPHLRTSRYGALSIIDSYEAQLKDAVKPQKENEVVEPVEMSSVDQFKTIEQKEAKVYQLRDDLLCDESKKDAVMEFLHSLGDGEKGKGLARMSIIAQRAGVVKDITFAMIKTEFNDVGHRSGFDSQKGRHFSDEEINPFVERLKGIAGL